MLIEKQTIRSEHSLLMDPFTQQRKKRSKKKKSFKKMTPLEKKERITYLWDILRAHVRQFKFINWLKRDLLEGFLVEFVQDPLDPNVDLAQHQLDLSESEQKRPKWYLID